MGNYLIFSKGMWSNRSGIVYIYDSNIDCWIGSQLFFNYSYIFKVYLYKRLVPFHVILSRTLILPRKVTA